MIYKFVRVVFIAVLVFSVLNYVAPALNRSTSQSYLVHASYSEPNVTRLSEGMSGDLSGTSVTGLFQNNENFNVSGIATATVKTSPNAAPIAQQSNTTILPANSQTWITILFSNIPYQNGYAITITFNANPVSNPAGGGSGTQTPQNNGGTGTTSTSGKTSTSTGGFNAGSLVVPLIVVGAVVVGSMGGLFMFRKTRLSEEKIRRFTSYDYQNWVMQRLGAQPSSVLDSRRGIDGFTGDKVPLAIKQSDNISRLQVDSFINALIQAKTRQGAIVAFDFDTEARAAVTRARMNRMDIKLVTVKELIDHKDTALL